MRALLDLVLFAMAADFSWEPVPPWVYGFNKLNRNEVEIVEMTHPCVTEMAPPDQAIKDRIGFTVLLLRRAIPQEGLQKLSKLAPKTFRDIQEVKKYCSRHPGWYTDLPCLASSQISKL